MHNRLMQCLSISLVVACSIPLQSQDFLNEPPARREARMEWWREARFGLFIHWGLYAIPAGEWKGKKDYGEWIRNNAEIPVAEYEKFVGKFNPVKFNAVEWVRMAKNAGMKYIVITSKHHDGFCLFDSEQTDFDVMSTPFHRDILKELAEACRQEGIKLCFYHSIMDWHHPDYLPRRPWEEATRPADGANFGRYIQYMKNELRELLTNYGPIGVLWFDGEWESTWNSTSGTDLYNYVRGLQPSIIINNRVGAGRSGMEGMTKTGEFAGDFGTPEQEIPSTGLPGVDWETCMTMNDHWGYNKNDQDWKSSTQLIQMLADIASKGGNFLLNVGPTSEGVFPPASVERLHDIGDWMKVNGESIHGTTASPFKNLPWGRCTQRPMEGGTKLYLHVFDWPSDGRLALSGLLNRPRRAYLLADQGTTISFERNEDMLVLTVPPSGSTSPNRVVVLEIEGSPDVTNPPVITSDQGFFLNRLLVSFELDHAGEQIRYTTDGTVPTAMAPLASGPLEITSTTLISARAFHGSTPVTGVSTRRFEKVIPLTAQNVAGLSPGISYRYYEGEWDTLPGFSRLTPVKQGTLESFSFSPRRQEDRFAFVYTGYVKIDGDAVCEFSTNSDDGSRLFIDDSLVVENDGSHSMTERTGVIALAAGFHALRVEYFERTGGDGLEVSIRNGSSPKRQIPDSILFH